VYRPASALTWLRRNAFLTALITAMCLLLVGLYVVQHSANGRADRATTALERSNARQAATIQALARQLRSHGLVPNVSVTALPGATGGTGGNGARGGRGGKGGDGADGGKGGKGGTGGKGGAVVVALTPAPGPSGSPGAAGSEGSPGAAGSEGSPGPEGSPGARGADATDECDWQPDPFHSGQQVCTRPSPTPTGAP
jgi:hypothetical protein